MTTQIALEDQTQSSQDQPNHSSKRGKKNPKADLSHSHPSTEVEPILPEGWQSFGPISSLPLPEDHENQTP